MTVRLYVFAILMLSASVAAQGDPAKLVAQLGSEDWQKRYDAYRALADKPLPAAIPLLVRALPGYHSYAQSLGVSLLRQYPWKRARPALKKLAEAASPVLRLRAAVALHRGGESGAMKIVLAALDVPGLKDDQRRDMLSELYGLADPAIDTRVRAMLVPTVGVGLLDSLLTRFLYASDMADPGVRKAVATLLENAGATRAVRGLCAAFLVTDGSAEYVPAMVKLIAKGDSSSLRSAWWFLGRATRLHKDVLTAIRKRAETEKDSHVVWQLVDVLANLKDRELGLLLRRLSRSDNKEIRKIATTALVELPGALDVADLRKQLGSSDPELVLAAAEMLQRKDDNSGLDAVVALARKGSYRYQAVRLLGKFTVRAAVEPLLNLLLDSEKQVRDTALDALAGVLRRLFPYRGIQLESTGYAVDAKASAREAAVKRIVDWWHKRNK